MRISDWSSDVCSYDLVDAAGCDHDRARLAHLRQRVDVIDRIAGFRQIDDQHRGAGRHRQRVDGVPEPTLVDRLHRPADLVQDRADALCRLVIADKGGKGFPQGAAAAAVIPRSEEHTSELQSLMRISYAVFCLKKKN